MKKQLILLMMTLLPLVISAHDISVIYSQGYTIYYKWINNNTELAVTFQGNNIATNILMKSSFPNLLKSRGKFIV